MRVALEIIAITVEDALAAEAGGADRLELITDFSEGGVTPSPGVIEAVASAVKIPVYAMIRPRGGNFVYSPAEVQAMVTDARLAREHGAAGLVFGALTPAGSLDLEAMGRIAEAGGLPFTCHRAFDRAADQFAALEALRSLPGFERVLTSGGAPSAALGLAQLKRLVSIAGPVEIQPGAGVNLQNIVEIVQGSACPAIHLGTAVREPNTVFGPVSEALVRQARELLG